MNIVSLVTWVVFGAIVGCAARAVFAWVIPAAATRVPDSWAATVALGVAGSVAGGLPFGTGPAGLLGSVVGAVVVILMYSWYPEADQ